MIALEYLIMNDPTYVLISDKMKVEFLDYSKPPTEGKVIKLGKTQILQKKAIRIAVSNSFSLFQGLPVTCKTHTIDAIEIRNEPKKKKKKDS